MSDRGGEWFDDGERVFWWPRCHVSGCPNFICTHRSDRFCWPHSDSGTTFKAMLEKFGRKKQLEHTS